MCIQPQCTAVLNGSHTTVLGVQSHSNFERQAMVTTQQGSPRKAGKWASSASRTYARNSAKRCALGTVSPDRDTAEPSVPVFSTVVTCGLIASHDIRSKVVKYSFDKEVHTTSNVELYLCCRTKFNCHCTMLVSLLDGLGNPSRFVTVRCSKGRVLTVGDKKTIGYYKRKQKMLWTS